MIPKNKPSIEHTQVKTDHIPSCPRCHQFITKRRATRCPLTIKSNIWRKLKLVKDLQRKFHKGLFMDGINHFNERWAMIPRSHQIRMNPRRTGCRIKELKTLKYTSLLSKWYPQLSWIMKINLRILDFRGSPTLEGILQILVILINFQ